MLYIIDDLLLDTIWCKINGKIFLVLIYVL